MLNPLIEKNRQAILSLAQQKGVKRISIFGSMARGKARSDSDVDFLVALEEGRDLFDLGALQFALQQLLQRKVDVVTENSLYYKIREQVLKEAVSL